MSMENEPATPSGPTWIQCHRVTLAPPGPNPPVSSVMTTAIAMSQVRTMSPTGTMLAAGLP